MEDTPPPWRNGALDPLVLDVVEESLDLGGNGPFAQAAEGVGNLLGRQEGQVQQRPEEHVGGSVLLVGCSQAKGLGFPIDGLRPVEKASTE